MLRIPSRPLSKRLLALALLLPAGPALAGGDNLLLIEKLASSFSADEREQAAIKLGYQPGPEVVDALVGALKDVDPNVRAAAARSLGKVGDASSLDPLQTATKDREEIVASEAQRALKKLSKKPLKPAPTPAAGGGGMFGSGLASKRKPAEVEELQSRVQKRLIKCITRYARKHAEFTGVTVIFSIRPDGSIGGLTLPELPEPGSSLEECIGKLFAGEKLEPAAGGDMTVSWPMMLSP